MRSGAKGDLLSGRFLRRVTAEVPTNDLVEFDELFGKIQIFAHEGLDEHSFS